MKIGLGYDVHRLIEGRKLILGGVEIPFSKGCLGHSDADVLIHSLIDALLGALALGDIGKLFPDSDDKYKDIDSRILLRKSYNLVKGKDYQIGNIDITICLQEPKLCHYIEAMRKNLASDLETDIANISVKATTEEGLGISGSQDGVCCYSVVLLNPIS
ncbi:MAG: 2-C-methyl-D-erythritol 2,4-cyclodiphosphate synthase [Candidatus Cloacimonetes bacterium]|nr:2-C-methyl-D-erythritol 2,4-cyclodiphosphate synthase [Candidatus Cloacimonadota bacterium]